MKKNNIYFDFQKSLSYNAMFSFYIGERGVGKTYGAKEFVIKRFKKKGKQFVYLRRYKTEIEKSVGTEKNQQFFKQIKNLFPDDTLYNNSSVMKINGKICGYALSLSTANILKSTAFDDVDTIIFDEFIIDVGCYHYLHNEVENLLDIVETIGRTRDIRVIFLGNAISSTNPYFTYFDLSLPYGNDIKTFKDGLILLQYIRNMDYREMKKQTRFGKLTEGTPYSRYAIDNEFLRDSKAFIGKKTDKSKFYFMIKYNQVEYGVWNNYHEGIIYISKDIDKSCPIVFAFDKSDHNENTILFRSTKSVHFQLLLSYYRTGKLKFENQKLKNEVLPLLNKYVL